MNEDKGILSILSGEKPVRLSVEIDYISSITLGVTIFIVALILIIINKKI